MCSCIAPNYKPTTTPLFPVQLGSDQSSGVVCSIGGTLWFAVAISGMFPPAKQKISPEEWVQLYGEKHGGERLPSTSTERHDWEGGIPMLWVQHIFRLEKELPTSSTLVTTARYRWNDTSLTRWQGGLRFYL